MTREEFERLRDLPGKVVEADIRFTRRRAGAWLGFSNVLVETGGEVLRVNGQYRPAGRAVVYNFVVESAGGPICRVCVRNTEHPGAGRTHKHDLRGEADPAANLPQAVARPDLDALGPREVWETICRQAKIEHRGAFHDPEGSADLAAEAESAEPGV